MFRSSADSKAPNVLSSIVGNEIENDLDMKEALIAVALRDCI